MTIEDRYLSHTGCNDVNLSIIIVSVSPICLWIEGKLGWKVASYPGFPIMWGREREPDDYCFAHALNLYTKFLGYVKYFTHYDDL